MTTTKLINTGTAKSPGSAEDTSVLDAIDTIFNNKRGCVVNMPEKGAPVLACMSGGLDSTCNVAFLLESGLEVYPFFINREQSNLESEKRALDWYNSYFKERYDSYHPCFEVDLTVPSKSYKGMLRATKHLQDHPEMRALITYPARNPIMFLAGMEYGYALQSKGIKPKTMFICEHADDFSIHGTLTLMRITNLMFCYLLQDWDFQFISLPIEREFGNHYGKDRLVKYADEIGLPLEHTRSCCDASEIHCGYCKMACYDRRMAFKKAGVEDRTKYLNPMPVNVSECREDTAENWEGKK